MPKTITQLPAASSADRGAVVAADNAAGTLTQRVTLGQIADLAPPSPRLNPPGMAHMVTVMSSDSVSITVKSTTGYVAARWWDGSVQVFGSGVAENDITVSRAVPTSGNWSKSAPKEFFVWSCTAANATQSGNLTSLECFSNQLTSLNVSGLTALTSLECFSNQLTSLNVSGLTALTYLYCFSNQLTSLNVSGLTALTSLECFSNQLTSLNVSGLTALTSLGCFSNQLTSLNVSGLTALTSLYCYGNQLTSLNVSGLTALTYLECYDNQLISIRAVGVSPNYADLSFNPSLSAAALNQFYTDLDPGNGTISVFEMPNATTSDNPSIATAKGYAVVGSD